MELPFNINLDHKVAVITGGAGDLCSSFALALAEAGARVALLDIDKEKAEAVAGEIKENGGQALALETDVISKEALMEAREAIHKEFGRGCDILINGAGGNHPDGSTTREYLEIEDLKEEAEEIQTFFDLTVEGIKSVFDLNFLGTLLASQVFSRDMVEKEDPVIINVSSMNAFRPLTKIPVYSGAKAAVSNFTQWLAVHMSKVGIRVNALAPGFFITEQNKFLLTNKDGSYTERAQKVLSQTPMDRFGTAQDLIGTLLWLVEPEASGFVNGTVIPVDGGFSAYSGV